MTIKTIRGKIIFTSFLSIAATILVIFGYFKMQNIQLVRSTLSNTTIISPPTRSSVVKGNNLRGGTATYQNPKKKLSVIVQEGNIVYYLTEPEN